MTGAAGGQHIGRDIVALFERNHRFARGLASLRRRGIDKAFLRQLALAGPDSLSQVALLVDETEPPAPRSLIGRAFIRLRVAFGGSDPDQPRRDAVAAFVERFNRAAAGLAAGEPGADT